MDFEIIDGDRKREAPVVNTGLSGCGQPGIVSRPDLWGMKPVKENQMKDGNGLEVIGRSVKTVCVRCMFVLRNRGLKIQNTETEIMVLVCPNSACGRFGLPTLAVAESETCLICPPKAPGYVQNPKTKALIRCPSCNFE